MWIKTVFQSIINSDNIISIYVEPPITKSKNFNVIAKMADGTKFILYTSSFDLNSFPTEAEAYQNAQSDAVRFLDELCKSMNPKKNNNKQEVPSSAII